VILLDAFKARMGFPELKATAIKHYKKWKPDAFIVEKKAAGAPADPRTARHRHPGQRVQPPSAAGSNDKIARLNACADMFASGKVWIPDTRWAWEVVEEVASFPNGDHDDYVDTTSQAMLRYRQGGFIPLDGTGISMTEQEAQACAAMGCTVWTEEELRKLVAIAMGRARETCSRRDI
jgi:predicted phage terminase large subunit-like protein